MWLHCTFKKIQLLTLLVAAFTIVTVLFILFFFNYPTFAKRRTIDALIFKNGSDSMERFKTTKDLKNLRLSFYLYNITNPIEVIESSAKIKIQEIGPFVYSEYKYKVFINNNQTSGLITHKLMKRYVFDRSLSIGDPKVVQITWPNVPLIVARSYLDNLSFFVRQAAYLAFNQAIKTKKEQPFITDTAENFIFDGSKRDLFEYLQGLDVLKVFNPWPLPDNKFALLYQKNDTWIPGRDREYTLAAGFGINQTYSDLNRYVYVNGSSTMSFWRQQPPKCNVVGGTDGEFFSPFLKGNEDLEVFSADICRKLNLKFRDTVYLKGISASKYTLDEKSLQSGRKNPENQCYCLSLTEDGLEEPECDLDGLMDLSTCSSPNVIGSGAHFIFGSPTLLSRIDGLTPPNSSIHEPVIFVEPNTGLTLNVRVPIQFNVRLKKGGFKIFNFFKDDQPLILPLMWAVETSEMTDEQASLLRDKLLLLDSWLVSMVLGGAIVFISAILVVAFIMYIRYRDSRVMISSEVEPLINPNIRSRVETDGEESQQPQTSQPANYSSI